MGVSKERRHAGRAIRRERRRRQWWREVARRGGFELHEWQIDVMVAQDRARELGCTFVWVSGRRGGRMVMRKVAEEAGR